MNEYPNKIASVDILEDLLSKPSDEAVKLFSEINT